MTIVRVLIGAAAATALGGCSGGKVDDRSAIVEACSTQQGIGWLRKEYGENYCECYADAAKAGLDGKDYMTLAEATREELKAEDAASREAIARRNTRVYSEASDLARRSCKK